MTWIELGKEHSPHKYLAKLIYRQFEHLEGTFYMREKHQRPEICWRSYMILVCHTKEGLQSLVIGAKIESEKAGLGMNLKKTKTMVVLKQEF